MFTRLPSAIRNLLVALVVIVAMLVAKSHFDRDDFDLPPHEEVSSPTVHVARDSKPTIVESNDGWLESTRGAGADDASLMHSSASELPPLGLRPDSLPTGLLPDAEREADLR